MQRHTTHYAAYDKYWEQVTPRDRGLVRHATCANGDVVITTRDGPPASVTYVEER